MNYKVNAIEVSVYLCPVCESKIPNSEREEPEWPVECRGCGRMLIHPNDKKEKVKA